MLTISFNGGHYDLQLIKPYLAKVYRAMTPPWLRRFRVQGIEDPSEEGDNEITSILKKGIGFMAIYAHKLTFLDVCNCLPAGGFVSAKYLSTYGVPACQGGKSFFPYKYMNDLARMPPYEAFYSSLHMASTLVEGQGPVWAGLKQPVLREWLHHGLR